MNKKEEALAKFEAQRRRRAMQRIKPPWKPIASAPRDGREILAAWMDDLGTWNLEIAHWSESDRHFLDQRGGRTGELTGWMPRPKFPGRPRQK